MAEDSSKTLFLRNLPFDTTSDALENIFGEIGPIKSCFVVKNRDTGKCRGYGYVKYSIREDAETAKKTIHSVDGRKLIIHYADKKPKKKREKNMKGAPLADDSDDDKSSSDESEDTTPIKSKPSTKEDKAKSQKKTRQKPEASEGLVTKKKDASATPPAVDKNAIAKDKHSAACTIIVKNFNPDLFKSDVKSILNGQKNVKEVQYPVPDRESNVAAILMKSKQDAYQAAKKLNKMKIKGDQISAQLLSVERAVAKTPEKPKKCRLIIRNMSFKCTEAKLKAAFAKFGEVTEVVIPKKPNGLMFGFGFVQFSTMAQASKALVQLNAKPLLGRPIAVDWAVSKNKYEEMTNKTNVPAESSDSGSFSSEGEDQAHDTGSESSEEEEEQEEEEEEEEMDVEESSSSSESENESETSDEEDEEDSTDGVKDTGSDSDSSDDDGFDEDDRKKTKASKKPVRKSDVDQGRTVFIRNLSYDTEDDGLAECFEQFGELVYSRIVMDPATEHSRGTAFVQFKEKLDAEKALEAADLTKGLGLNLDGRPLNLSLALPRDQAVKLQAGKKQKEEKDNRNLYLAREGLIRPGTKEAEGLSTDDLNKRMKVEMTKRQKLKNPNLFISSTRLCVRNIPVSVDDKQLRRIFMKYLKDKTARITECRVMRDLARVNSKGVAKSRGYAFIEFNEHRHALQALRTTNNNPEVFGDKKRLIIEFSLENRAALAAKEKRLERAKAKQEIMQKGKDTFVDVKGKKKNKWDNRNRQTITNPSVATTALDESENQLKKGPKGLPSHWGPKIRDRNKYKNLKGSKKNMDKQSRNQDQFMQQKRKLERVESKPKKRVKKTEVHDNLDVLVNKYRQQFSKAVTNAKGPGHRSKWFDT